MISGAYAFAGTMATRMMSRSSIITEKVMNRTVPLGAAIVSPGEILAEEFLEPMHLSHRELARRMGVSSMRVNEIIRGKRAITADSALRLAKVFDTTPRFWMNLQINYDLGLAVIAQGEAA
jgi:addiction module HigA family antidote